MERRDPRTAAQARTLRKTMTAAEQRLWQQLRLRQARGYKFRRQHPIGPYVVDFICLEARLVVEVDAARPESAGEREHDPDRVAWLGERDYRVIRFRNDDVLGDTLAVVDAIGAALGGVDDAEVD